MSYLNTFLEKQVKVRKRKTRSDKKHAVRVWMCDEDYKKTFVAAKKNKQTITQFCSDVVINELQKNTFSLIKYDVEFRQVNIKLPLESYEKLVDFAADFGCLSLRETTHRILHSGLRGAGVL